VVTTVFFNYHAQSHFRTPGVQKTAQQLVPRKRRHTVRISRPGSSQQNRQRIWSSPLTEITIKGVYGLKQDFSYISLLSHNAAASTTQLLLVIVTRNLEATYKITAKRLWKGLGGRIYNCFRWLRQKKSPKDPLERGPMNPHSCRIWQCKQFKIEIVIHKNGRLFTLQWFIPSDMYETGNYWERNCSRKLLNIPKRTELNDKFKIIDWKERCNLYWLPITVRVMKGKMFCCAGIVAGMRENDFFRYNCEIDRV
jgi:hypothetical protein